MYTAEEYRNVLKGILDMDMFEREEAFGTKKPALKYAIDYPASEIIEKYNVYINMPRTGEYWKHNVDGEMVVVRYVDKNTVRVYYCDGGYNNSFSYKYFVGSFAKTEYKSKYLEDFLNEMKEVGK